MKATQPGKVYLVGAGPGDPSLITVRGRDLLKQADVIVVDDLVSPLHLLSNPTAQIIYVGKRGPGSPSGSFKKLSQDGINQLLVKLASQNKKVVRLKGGDPLIFGRGGEEMEALRHAKISYEVVPGVSSAVAGPAYGGIPLSDRRWASEITFLTGQKGSSPDNRHFYPPKMVDNNNNVGCRDLTPSGTLVYLMGVGGWTQIKKKLLSMGWPAKKPVAAIQSATLSEQQILITTLKESAAIFKKRKLVSPAIIVVGDVANLSRRLAWVQKEKPLLGRSVVVTRPESQSEGLIHELEDQGAFVVRCPAILIQPLMEDPRTLTIVDQLKRKKFSYDWIIFLSENGARIFHQLTSSNLSWRGRSKIMAIGPQTKSVLESLGWPVHRVAAEFNSSGVLRSLQNVKNKKILLARAQNAPTDLTIGLRKKGAMVDEISLYQTIQAPPPSARLKELILKGVDAVTFTSASTVENFLKFFTKAEVKRIFSQSTAISIGPVTTSALQRNGIKNVVQAKQATTADLVRALIAKKRI